MRKNQSKNKDLCNLQVVTADKVWNKDHKSLRKDLNIYGKVEKSCTAYVSSSNLKGKKFNNENRKVIYLVKKSSK